MTSHFEPVAIACDMRLTADGTAVVFHDRRPDVQEDSRGITSAISNQPTATVTTATILETGV